MATRPLTSAEEAEEQRYLRLVTTLLRFEAPGSVVFKPISVYGGHTIRILTLVELVSLFYNVLFLYSVFSDSYIVTLVSRFQGHSYCLLSAFWHSHCQHQLLKLTSETVSSLNLDCRLMRYC